MKTIEYTDAQSVMAQIAEALAKGEEFTLTPKKPEKWKPKRVPSGGKYYFILSDWNVGSSQEIGHSVDRYRHAHGNYFLRKDHAEKARNPDRLRNKFRLFVLEHAPDFDVYGKGWVVHLNAHGVAFSFPESCPNIGSIQAPEEVAQKFRDLFNAGLIDMGDE